jgi:DNA ligase (NAD+)
MQYKEIIVPTSCPSCSSELELVKDQLFCRSKNCSAQSTKKVEHFAKTLKIKGLGPKTIEKLGLYCIPDIYSISSEEIIAAIGEKLGTKLFSKINESKQADLSTLLAAFSIPLIGNTAATKLTSVIIHVDEINEDSCLKAGLGPKACESLIGWKITDFYGNLDSLPFDFKTAIRTKPPAKENGKSVCITGKLKDYKNRTLAGDYLKSLGYKITSSVTKKTDFLVDEEGKQSSKRTKAEGYGIQILTINDLIG